MIDFALGDCQYQVFQDRARYRVLIAGRRFGKTHLACIELLMAAAETPGCDVWYLGPTLKQSKRGAWRKFKNLVPRELIANRNESDLFIELVNGSRITVLGRNDPDNLRGEGLRRVVNDEFCVQQEGDKGLETWEAVVRPMLSDTGGDALFISTPKGHNWGYDFYLRGQDPAYSEWKSWQFTTLQGGRVPAETIAADKRDMDPRRFRQEYEASFESPIGRVYDNFDRYVHVAPVEDMGGTLYIGQDFNVHPMASVIAQRVVDQCHVIDALEIPASHTEEVAREIKQRYPNRDIVFCPDPTGKARKTSAGGKTDFSILQEAGFRINAPSSPPHIPDRINNVQRNLMAADGTVRIQIDPRARCLIRALDGQCYKEGTSIPDKTAGVAGGASFDHINDAFGYLLWAEFNLFIGKATVEAFRL